MADPITFQVLAAVQTVLGAIQVANGYYTDAGLSVELEPVQARDLVDPLIVVSVAGFIRPAEAAMANVARGMSIRIAALVPVTLTDAELRLHEILDDIDRAMADQQAAFPERCSFPKFVSATRLQPADGLPCIGVDVIYQTTIRRAR